MATLIRQAGCMRPVSRAEIRTPQQTLFHLVASSSSCSRIQSTSNKQRRGRPVLVNATAASEAAKSLGPAGDEDSKNFAIAVARVVDEVKCSDIVVLDVAPVVSWTSFLVVATVFSKPQLLAALARVEKAAAEHHGRGRLNLPGSSPWETLDFGDVVLHLFTAEQRDFYDIESFYAAAEEVDVPFGPQEGTAGLSEGAAKAPPTWSTRL